jgi:hypothetical protein
MEKNIFDQRYAIKFCVKLRKGATDTYEKIQRASGKDSPLRAQAFRCYKDLANGRETIGMKSGCLCLRTSTYVDRVRALFLKIGV